MGVAAAVLAAVLAGAPAVARSDEVIAQPERGTPVDADVGVLVFSAYDRGTRRFRLTSMRNGRVETLRTRPQRSPVDADVGTDAAGDPVLAYSACAAGSCDVRLYSFEDGRDRRVARASRPGVDERAPTVWAGRLAWVAGGRSVKTGSVAADGTRTRTLPRLPGRRCGFDDLNERRCGEADYINERLELRGPSLARVVRADTPFSDDFEVLLTDLRRPGRSRLVDSFSPGESSGKRYLGLSIDGPFLHFYTTCTGEGGGCLRRSGAFRFGLRSRRLELAGDRGDLTGFTVDRGVTVVASGEDRPETGRVCALEQDQQDESTIGPCPVIRRSGAADYQRVPR